MAKTKGKSKSKSKAKKSTKNSKVKKSQKTVKAVAKKPAVKQEPVEVIQAQRNSQHIMVGVIVSFVVALFMGALLIGSADDKSVQSSAKPTTNPNAQQTIEVKAPNNPDGTPQSTDYNLQGSSPEGQNAQGGLQKPQTADQLQPNAKIQDYENAELN